jgi:hypothetical protein
MPCHIRVADRHADLRASQLRFSIKEIVNTLTYPIPDAVMGARFILAKIFLSPIPEKEHERTSK